MSQHDMTVDNGAGVAVRADINLALKALASQSSGPSAPSPSYPAQIWADTGTGRLKQRDSTDAFWIDRGILDALGEVQTVASATLTDIASATSEVISISGTTTIASLGTVVAGVIRKVRFLGSLVLTHNATSLILPAGASITTSANDTAEFQSLGSGNWLCLRYTLASGKALAFGYDRSNVLGAVSQLAGVPTGALMDTGSNANGTYAKYADGTLICTFNVAAQSVSVSTAYGGLFYGLPPLWTFPVTFVGTLAYVGLTAYALGRLAWATRGNTASLSSAQFAILDVNSTTSNYQLSYIAIGRWY